MDCLTWLRNNNNNNNCRYVGNKNNINYMIYSASGPGRQLHSQSSPGYISGCG